MARGTTQITLSNIIVRLLSIITMPLLTRLLEPSAYGTASLITTLTSLLSVFALAGADVSYIRAYHGKAPRQMREVEALTWRFAMMRAIAAACAVIGIWGVVSNIFKVPNYAGAFVAIGTVLSVAMTMATARARLRERHRAISLGIVAAGFAGTAIAVAFARLGRTDELPLILSSIFSYLLPLFVLGLPPVATIWQRPRVSVASRNEIIGIGWAVIVTAPAYWLISSSDRWMLAYFHDASTAGIYSVGYSIATIGMTINSAFFTVWTPEATKIFETDRSARWQKITTVSECATAFLACVWLAVTAAGNDVTRLLAGPAFYPAMKVIPIIAGTVFLHGIIHLANVVCLLENRLQKTVVCWVAGSAACLILGIILIPRFGLQGAALSQLGSLSITTMCILIQAKRMFRHFNCIRIFIVLLSVAFAGVIMWPAWSDSPLRSLILKFPIGITITAIILFLYRDGIPWPSHHQSYYSKN